PACFTVTAAPPEGAVVEPRSLPEPFPEEDLDAGSGFAGGVGTGNECEGAGTGIDSCESARPEAAGIDSCESVRPEGRGVDSSEFVRPEGAGIDSSESIRPEAAGIDSCESAGAEEGRVGSREPVRSVERVASVEAARGPLMRKALSLSGLRVMMEKESAAQM